MSRSTHYRWLEEDEAYVNAVDDALESYRDSIRAEVHRRAIEGWQEPVAYQGQIARDKKGRPVTITKYSDRMLELLEEKYSPWRN